MLPIESNSGNWRGTEYLQLYPEMKFDKNRLEVITQEEILIQFREKQDISLKQWLTS